MIFAAIMDAGLIPFIALTAILARSQLNGTLENNEQQWASLFGTGYQTHIVILSTHLISVVEGSLLLSTLCISIFLALVFRKISKLPPDMNPLEDNLTSRHKRNKSSMSTAFTDPSNRDSATPLMSPSRSVPFAHTRSDSPSNPSQPQRRGPTSSRNSYIEFAGSIYEQPNVRRASRMDLSRTSRPTSTIHTEQSSPSMGQSPSHPRSAVYLEHRNSPFRPTSTIYADVPRGTPRPPSSRPLTAGYKSVEQDDSENWVSHPSPPPSPPRFAPPELQHLRNLEPPRSHRASPPAPIKPTRYDKYDYASRTPKPLGMNPPTPLDPELRRSFEARALRDSDGNAYPRYTSPSVWQDVRLDNDTPSSSISGMLAGKRHSKIYGDLQEAPKTGRTTQGLGRIVSSGVETSDSKLGKGVRAREVSGKLVEEGRGRTHDTEF